jgi:hypothetical protein
MMLYAGPNVKRIFVLYTADPYNYSGPGGADRWLMFNDTYSGS